MQTGRMKMETKVRGMMMPFVVSKTFMKVIDIEQVMMLLVKAWLQRKIDKTTLIRHSYQPSCI